MKRISIVLLTVCMLLVGCNKGSAGEGGNADPIAPNVQDEVAGEINTDQQNESEHVNDGAENELPEVSSAPDFAVIDEQVLITQFYGLWTNKDDEGVFLELEEGKELIGVKYGDLFSTGEFSVSEVNSAEQAIIIEGFAQDIEYGEDEAEPVKRPFISKLYLKNNGKELLYVYDYLESKVESEWFK